jgi:hypothetical protein
MTDSKEKDLRACEDAFRSYSEDWGEQYAEDQWDSYLSGFEAGFAHRDAEKASDVKELVEALKRVDCALRCEAAEYVPAIPEAWSIIDAALEKHQAKGDGE